MSYEPSECSRRYQLAYKARFPDETCIFYKLVLDYLGHRCDSLNAI